jgi:hypothetical protein
VIVALLGLIFASTFASVSHSSVMPMAGFAPMASGQASAALHHGAAVATGHDATPAGHDMGKGAHDCETDAAVADSRQSPPSPCEHGCQQCKDCTTTSFTLISPAVIDAAERYRGYRSGAVLVLTGIAPPSPNEPPRV